ncbi:UBX domain family protein [Babesia bovis T2Bo]|uniref:UBX domain-containing protein n=1 Tax=Babesia bovis TaxID=5865 RepID=A7AVA2_BABBO|nr:UBX domain family protein [Babesia bovis T2Bo]EDO05728.1 UBX domain family protein [Babesia bovis T2Bo]|eukprot:XP_001609296.1 hypothetical protein [Babesia bovis T2Bo]
MGSKYSLVWQLLYRIQDVHVTIVNVLYGLYSALCYILTWCVDRCLSCVGLSSSPFTKYFESKYGQLHPQFYEGSFQSVKANAFHNGKLLAIYLHSDTTRFSSEHFFTNELLTEILDTNYILYVRYGKGPVMRRLIYEFGVQRLPHISIIAMRNLSDYTVIATLEDFSSIDNVISTIASAVESPLRPLSNGDGNLDNDRNLINEQDEALKRAMEADISRMRMNQFESAVHVPNTNCRETVLKNRADTIRRRKSFAEEFSSTVPDGDTKIKVRLPSGSSIESIFRKDDTVGRLYEWVGAAEYFSAGKVKIPYDFDICTMFPSKTLSDRTQTLESANLCPNASLVLISRDDSDEEYI